MFDAKKYFHDRYHKFKSEHRCVVCGEQLDESTKDTKCEFCREKQKAAERKCYLKRKRRKLLSALQDEEKGGGEE